jgi:hypothetical protein
MKKAAGVLACGAIFLVIACQAITVDMHRVNLDEIMREYQRTPAVPTMLVELSEDPLSETGEESGQPKCVPNVPNVRGILPSSCCGDNKCPLHLGTCCAGDTHCCAAGSICLQGDPGTPPGCLNIVDYIPKSEVRKFLRHQNAFGVNEKEGPNGEPLPTKIPIPEGEPARKKDGSLNYEDAFAPHDRNSISKLRVITTTNHHISQIIQDATKKTTNPSVDDDATTIADPVSTAMKPSSVSEKWDEETRRAVGDLPAEDPKELLKRVEDQIKQFGEGSEESGAPVTQGDAPYLVMIPSKRHFHHEEVKSEQTDEMPLQVVLQGPTPHTTGPVEARSDELMVKAKAVLDYKFKQVAIDPSLAPKQSPVAPEDDQSEKQGSLIPELDRLGVPEALKL